MNCYAPDIENIRTTLFNRALDQKVNFVMDGTGKDFTAWSNLAGMAQQKGFQTRAAMVVIDVPVAVGRIAERAAATGRNVDLDYAKSAYEKVESNIKNYLESDKFDVF